MSLPLIKNFADYTPHIVQTGDLVKSREPVAALLFWVKSECSPVSTLLASINVDFGYSQIQAYLFCIRLDIHPVVVIPFLLFTRKIKSHPDHTCFTTTAGAFSSEHATFSCSTMLPGKGPLDFFASSNCTLQLKKNGVSRYP